MKISACLLTAAIALAGCSSDEVTDGPSTLSCTEATTFAPALGEMFNVRVGDQVVLVAEDLELRLVAVLEDSRCPMPVLCLVPGSVTVGLDVTHQENGFEHMQLTLGDGGIASKPFGEYEIQLMGVAPRPHVDYVIQPTGYCAALIVVRVGVPAAPVR